MPGTPYDNAKRSVEALPPGDQLRLIAELAGRLGSQLERQPRRSMLELRGLGKRVWQDIDVDGYLRRGRLIVGRVESFRGSTVGLDTGPLIYYIEEHPTFLARVAPFFEASEHGEFRIVTSLVTLIEVLTHPLREGRPRLVR